jgi:hypothetical protein
MKISDLINLDDFSEFVKWYIETTRPLEDARLAYCRKSFGLIPKGMVKEMLAARRLDRKKPSKKTQ